MSSKYKITFKNIKDKTKLETKLLNLNYFPAMTPNIYDSAEHGLENAQLP